MRYQRTQKIEDLDFQLDRILNQGVVLGDNLASGEGVVRLQDGALITSDGQLIEVPGGGFSTTVDWATGITGKPMAFPPSEHNHDSRYYTQSQIDALIDALDELTPVPHALDSDRHTGRLGAGQLPALGSFEQLLVEGNSAFEGTASFLGSPPFNVTTADLILNLNAQRLNGFLESDFARPGNATGYTWVGVQLFTSVAEFQGPTVPFTVAPGTGEVEHLWAARATDADDATLALEALILDGWTAAELLDLTWATGNLPWARLPTGAGAWAFDRADLSGLINYTPDAIERRGSATSGYSRKLIEQASWGPTAGSYRFLQWTMPEGITNGMIRVSLFAGASNNLDIRGLLSKTFSMRITVTGGVAAITDHTAYVADAFGELTANAMIGDAEVSGNVLRIPILWKNATSRFLTVELEIWGAQAPTPTWLAGSLSAQQSSPAITHVQQHRSVAGELVVGTAATPASGETALSVRANVGSAANRRVKAAVTPPAGSLILYMDP